MCDNKSDYLSNFDRIFFWPNGNGSEGAVLLFSKKKQEFICSDPLNGKFQLIPINTKIAYQQVELYDNKLFYLNRQSLVLDVFFDSKKQCFFHKRTFHFSSKHLILKENFCLTVWKHQESGTLYRCLLGPLEDGRYMSFDLLERYFNPEANSEQVIAKIFYISMEMENNEDVPQDIVYAFNEGNKSIICYNENNFTFYEYNDFAGKETVLLQVTLSGMLKGKKVKRMYFHYPYEYLPQKEKNKLKTSVKSIAPWMDINTFVKNRYKEVILCMEGDSLIKMMLLEDTPLPMLDQFWILNKMDCDGYIPVDIAINTKTGQIYCLCKQDIMVLPDSGRKWAIINEKKYKRVKEYFKQEEFS